MIDAYNRNTIMFTFIQQLFNVRVPLSECKHLMDTCRTQAPHYYKFWAWIGTINHVLHLKLRYWSSNNYIFNQLKCQIIKSFKVWQWIVSRIQILEMQHIGPDDPYYCALNN